MNLYSLIFPSHPLSLAGLSMSKRHFWNEVLKVLKTNFKTLSDKTFKYLHRASWKKSFHSFFLSFSSSTPSLKFYWGSRSHRFIFLFFFCNFQRVHTDKKKSHLEISSNIALFFLLFFRLLVCFLWQATAAAALVCGIYISNLK